MAAKKSTSPKKRSSAKKSAPAKARRSPRAAGTKKAAPAASARKTARPRRSANGQGLLLVGIGASAGGLEAVTRLLQNLPPNTGMAFVFIQHLDPRHVSQLPEVLARSTKMPVVEAATETVPAPNHLYVMPSNVQLTLSRGALAVSKRPPGDGHLFRPIDVFFESLAAVRGQASVGVVLSGTGTDGTLGLTAIKAAGGVTFAQEEVTAQFPGMPLSAIAAGAADFILSPEKIADKLAQLPRHPYIGGTEPEIAPAVISEADALQQIMAVLKAKTGVDFEAYKRSTFSRRIQRRMLLVGVDTLPAYAAYLSKTPAEQIKLFQDVFIHVTSFFRGPESFTALQRKVFRRLTAKREAGLPVRIWVPGCSTGEEAYSVAIAWLEFAEGLYEPQHIQVFGTDISPAAIDKARRGRYSEAIAADLSPERLRRYFVAVHQGFQVAKSVRDRVVFAAHNLLSDPPFTQLDLICCRNLLIYLEPSHQQRIMQEFHYALRPGGFLMLGPSEDVSKDGDLFVAVDRKQRIYARSNSLRQPLHNLMPIQMPWARLDVAHYLRGTEPLLGLPSAGEVWAAANQATIDQYAPAAVVVNQKLDILHVRGSIGPFLEPNLKQGSRRLNQAAARSLRAPLARLVRQAEKTNVPVRREGLQIRLNKTTLPVAIDVTPFFISRAGPQRYFIVAFELLATTGGRKTSRAGARAGRSSQVANLVAELTEAQLSLLSTGERLDANSAELVAAVEELQSGNEELQSMNEELQTAKEELQSANEELTTLNEELVNRNHELNVALGNLNNLVESVRLPILIVGGNMRVRLYNSTAERVLSIVGTDIGRPLGEIKTRLNISELEPLISQVMRSLTPHDEEVQDREGRWYAMRIRPYQSLDNRIDGAVITWTDISAFKARQLPDRGDAETLANIAASLREPLLVLDAHQVIQLANAPFYNLFQTTEAETLDRTIFDLADGQWNVPELRRLLSEPARPGQPVRALEIDREFKKIGRRTLLLNAHRTALSAGQEEMTLMSIEDVTAVRQLTEMEQLRMLSGRLQSVREEERTRLSREIHDELGGMLTGLKLQLHQLRMGLNPKQGALNDLTQSMARQIDVEMDFVRRIASSLRPHLLDDVGIVAAMEWQLTEFQKQTGITAHFRSNVESLPPSMPNQTSIFRIFQEALTNVARHAAAKKLEVSLEVREGFLQLIMHDDGRGITPEEQASQGSLGLLGMRERAQQSRGYMDIRGAPNEGTTLRVRLPLNPADSRA